MKSNAVLTKKKGQFTIGRSWFEKVSAVVCIKTSPKMTGMFAEFDRQRLNPKERRRIIREKFTKTA